MLMYFRSRKKQTKEVSYYEPIGTDKEGNEKNIYTTGFNIDKIKAKTK